MQYNTISGTGITVSLLSLGTLAFGGQTSEPDSIDMIHYAYDKGINVFDTSDNYCQGESERILGKGIKGKRTSVILATKVFSQIGNDPNDSGLSRRHILAGIDASLKHLDTDYVDIYYMHAPDYKTPMEESMETMSSLVKAGKIRYIGVSNFAAWQIADLLAICEKRNYVAPIITQNVYNALTRGVEGELVPFLKEHHMGMTIFNPIAGGFLSGKHKAGKPEENTRFFNNKMYLDRYWSAENFSAIDKLAGIAGQNGLTLLQLAMKWCAGQKIVNSIISGVSRMSQLEENIASVEGDPLNAETLNQCDEVWRSLAGTRFAYNR